MTWREMNETLNSHYLKRVQYNGIYTKEGKYAKYCELATRELLL